MNRSVNGVLALLAALSSSFTGCRIHHESLQSNFQGNTGVPNPDIGSFLPHGYHSVSVRPVALDSKNRVEEVLVTSKGQAKEPGIRAPTNIIVIEWFELDRKWDVVFDASAAYDVSPQESKVLLPQSSWDILSVSSITISSGRSDDDLVIAAEESGGNGSWLTVGVVVLDDYVAEVAWTDDLPGGKITLDGPSADRQMLYLEGGYQSPVDLACCTVRDYKIVVGREEVTHTYRILSDDRPWLGLAVIEQAPSHPTLHPGTVVRVTERSPGQTIFKTGDVIKSVEGEAFLDSDKGLELPVVEEIARHHSGETIGVVVDRQGQQVTLRVRLGSLADRPNTAGGGNSDIELTGTSINILI